MTEPDGIELIYPPPRSELDGIAAYTRGLLAACEQRHGSPVRLVEWRRRGLPCESEVVVIQYNPFSYGRWGFAPALLRDVRRLRRRRPDCRVALMVHEPYVLFESPRTVPMSLWQRFQLRALLRQCEIVLLSTSAWRRYLPHGTRATSLAVGSNLPDRRSERDAARLEIGCAEDAIVLATFGTDHPSRLLGHVEAAANAVAATCGQATLLHLGSEAPALGGLSPAVTLRRPGNQTPVELARELSAADIFLAPFTDGVTTRRTSLVAALQHGLAIVGTEGSLTEAKFWPSEIALAPVAEVAAFVAAAVALAGDAEARRSAKLAARALYELNFAWPVLAEHLFAALDVANDAAGALRDSKSPVAAAAGGG